MNTVKIWPYSYGSVSSSILTRALRDKGVQARRLAKNGTWSQQASTNHIPIINWGNSVLDERVDTNTRRVINPTDFVNNCSHKGRCLGILSQDIHPVQRVKPVFNTANPYVVYDMLELGHKMVARHKLRGHSGQGIQILKQGDTIPDAPLFTRYIKKKAEYRMHFVIDHNANVNTLLQQKKRNRDIPDEEVDWEVRNYHNGFIYSVNSVDPLPGEEQWVLAGLTPLLQRVPDHPVFGAVDLVVANNNNPGIEEDSVHILEVNTAPGLLSPTLIEFYAENLKQTIHSMR